MRRIPFALFNVFIVSGLFLVSCEWKTTKYRVVKDDPQNDKPKHERTILDSAMISLKSFNTIALTDLLSQGWNMDDADEKHWNELFWDSLANKRKYPGLFLFSDFSATENPRADMKTGKWAIDKINRKLRLSFTDGSKKSYNIQSLSLAAMVLVLEKGDDSSVIKFSSDHLVHKRLQEDPFYPENNKWRIKPLAAENSDQIRERVRACVHFYSLFFKDNRQRQQDDISFIGLPCCFEWYNGGLGLPTEMELDKKWISCFYSEDQAYKGYDMLKTLLETNELKWPDHKMGWVIQTQAVLEQIYNKL